MTGEAHDRACARSEHPDTEEGVTTVVDALYWSLLALIDHDRPLTTGTTWTIRTGHTIGTRWRSAGRR